MDRKSCQQYNKHFFSLLNLAAKHFNAKLLQFFTINNLKNNFVFNNSIYKNNADGKELP